MSTETSAEDGGPLPRRPQLAYHDVGFLDGDEARPLRILSEYLRPKAEFARRGVHDSVVFFGSARMQEGGPLSRYIAEAHDLARLVTEWSARTRAPSHQCLVCTGGGGGIMEAANRGAADAGGRTIGLNIGLPHEQHPNPYITPELSFQFHYFFMRKLWFAHLARAIVVFPGGFGTLDELFETLTLTQTGKLERPIPVLLYGTGYWNEVVDFDALVRHGVIDASDLSLFRFVDDTADAMKSLEAILPAEPRPREPGFARSAAPERPGETDDAESGS